MPTVWPGVCQMLLGRVDQNTGAITLSGITLLIIFSVLKGMSDCKMLPLVLIWNHNRALFIQ